MTKTMVQIAKVASWGNKALNEVRTLNLEI